MPAGLRVWDEATGLLMIDTSTLLGRLIGVIDANTASGSATVAGLDQGIPFAIPQLQHLSSQYQYGTNTYPNCSFSGNVVSWTRQSWPGLDMPPCKLILGVR